MGWKSPTGHSDPDEHWTDEPNAYDGNTATFSKSIREDRGAWGSFLYLTLASAVASNKLRVWISRGADADLVDIDILKDGIWTHVYEGIYAKSVWTEKEFAQGSVSQVRLRFFGYAIMPIHDIYEVAVWEVVAAPRALGTAVAVVSVILSIIGLAVAINRHKKRR